MDKNMELEMEARSYLQEFFSVIEKDEGIDMKNTDLLRKYLESLKEDAKTRIKGISHSLVINEYKRLRDIERRKIAIIEEAENLFDEEYENFMAISPIIRRNNEKLRRNNEIFTEQIRSIATPLDSEEIYKRIEEQAIKNVQEKMNNDKEYTI